LLRAFCRGQFRLLRSSGVRFFLRKGRKAAMTAQSLGAAAAWVWVLAIAIGYLTQFLSLLPAVLAVLGIA